MNLHTMMLGALTASAIAGCASIDSVQDIDGKRTGIRYYNSAPFILAYTDGKGGIDAKLIYLPDTTRIMSLEPTAFFAQNKTVMTFVDSILTQSDTTADATAIPKAIVEAAKTVAMAAISANDPKQLNEYRVPAPYLFRLHFGPADPKKPESKSWRLVGGQAVDRDGVILPVNSTFVRAVE